MRDRRILLVLFSLLALSPVALLPALSATNPATSAASVPANSPNYTSESNPMKARELVDAAINMTDSERAVKLLWQATAMDPTLEEAYLYLGLFYNSRSNFGKVVEVYQRLVKYEPRLVTAYLNIGEAYMSFTTPYPTTTRRSNSTRRRRLRSLDSAKFTRSREIRAKRSSISSLPAEIERKIPVLQPRPTGYCTRSARHRKRNSDLTRAIKAPLPSGARA